MFSRIANHYDFMNRIMTAGQDTRWRKKVIRLAALPAYGWLLDLGTGTGSLAQEAKKQYPSCRVTGVDRTEEMMRVGTRRMKYAPGTYQSLDWCLADTLDLPFPDQTFEAVVSGFLLRNASDIRQSIADQYRVLKPGGRIVCLDTSPPIHSLFSPLTRFYLHTMIPILGSWITGDSEAYQYLSTSTENFLSPEKIADHFIQAGFQEVDFQSLMYGTIAIHWGRKP